MGKIIKLISVLSITLIMSITTVAMAAQIVDDEFLAPSGIMEDSEGNIYIADEKNNNIVKINGNTIEVIAGYTLPDNSYGYPAGGYLDNSDALKSLFNGPTALIEWNGGIVVSDTNNHVLRFIKDGEVTTLAGTGESGFKNGNRTYAQFYLPHGLAVDDSNNLYIADSGNGVIRKISSTGFVSTYCDELNTPCGLDWYDGALYVSDLATNQIYKIQDDEIIVVAGLSLADEEEYTGGYVDGLVDVAQFNMPQGIDVSEKGIAVADTGNSAVRLIKDGEVTTLIYNENKESLWPIAPSDVLYINGILYAVDPFSGVVVNNAIFTDGDENSWWMESAIQLSNLGIISGVGDNKFAPNDDFSRTMIAQILYDYASVVGLDIEVDSYNNFTDVASDLWYSDAVNWMYFNGVSYGYGDGTFGVSNSVLRQDILVLLYRYTQLMGTDVDAIYSLAAFTDNEDISAYATDAVNWAVSKGIITGFSDSTIKPLDTASRAEAAVMILNWINTL